MRPSDELRRACQEQGLYAVCQGDGVRAWLPSQAGPWPVPDDALWVLPGYDPYNGAPSWIWEQGPRRGRHRRGDIAGAAAAVAEFLRTGQTERERRGSNGQAAL